MKKIRKPFSIEAYNTGKYIVTNKFGDVIEIVTTESKRNGYEILARKFENGKWSVETFTKNGRYYNDDISVYDLELVETIYEAGEIVTLQFKEIEGVYVGIVKEHADHRIKFVAVRHTQQGTYIADGELPEIGIMWSRLATEAEIEPLAKSIDEHGKEYDHATNTLIEKPKQKPVAQVVEYEPIGKVYASGIEINGKLTKEQKIKIIKALAYTI